MKTAKEFFKEELSGEPLTQDSVIEGLNLFAKQLLEEYTNRIVENAEIHAEFFDEEGNEIYQVNRKSITSQLHLLLKELGI